MNIKNKVKSKLAKSFPNLAAAFRGYKGDPLEKSTPATTPFGFKFVGNKMMESGEFEKKELGIIQEYIINSDIVINIGANIGYYCCISLKSNKKLIAFEPDQNNLKVLYKNIHINNWTNNYEIFPIALGNHVGLVELFGNSTGTSLIEGWAGSSSKSSRLAPCSTLDLVLGDRLFGKKCFFLIDIEGAELLLLEGAMNHLNMKPQPSWIVEICIDEHQPGKKKINSNLLDTFEKFWRAGYKAQTVDESRRVIARDEIVNISQTEINTIETHNFLFTANNNKIT